MTAKGNVAPTPPMTQASELYAMTQGAVLCGPDECHWCGSPCQRLLAHDESPPLPGVRRTGGARRPGNTFVCLGCWLWRRKRITIRFLRGLKGDYKDGQCPLWHSWLVTDAGAWALRPEDRPRLWEVLLKPPLRFVLGLLDEVGETSCIHLMKVNDVQEVKADTPLTFTVNNVPYVYTVYELEEAILQGPEGREPGAQALLRLLGGPPEDLRSKDEPEKRGPGRPLKSETPNVLDSIRTVTA